MSKIKSRRPSTSARSNATTELEADIERWRVLGDQLRAKHPKLFDELIAIGRCALREFEPGDAFEVDLKVRPASLGSFVRFYKRLEAFAALAKSNPELARKIGGAS